MRHRMQAAAPPRMRRYAAGLGLVMMLAAMLVALSAPAPAVADHGPTLVPEPYPTGHTLVRYAPESPDDGVDVLVAALPAEAVSLHGSIDGELVSYIPGAPAFVNAEFVAEFSQRDIFGWAFMVTMPPEPAS